MCSPISAGHVMDQSTPTADARECYEIVEDPKSAEASGSKPLVRIPLQMHICEGLRSALVGMVQQIRHCYPVFIEQT